MSNRRGFALLAVLWVTVALAALGLSLSLVARQALGAGRNRNQLAKEEWSAEGCAARIRASIEVYLQSPPRADARGLSGWSSLDQVVTAQGREANDCEIAMRPAGDRLDVNAADAQTLRALLAGLRVDGPRRDSMVAALLDWRDSDDDPRELGAESSWYLRSGRQSPRNGALADILELHRVRGFEQISFDSVLDVEPGRVDLNHAPLSVIGSLPGFDVEAVSRMAEMRSERIAVRDLAVFSGALSPGAREVMLASFAELSRMTTTEPDAWVVTVRATGGSPAVGATVEFRLVRAGVRAAIVRRRSGVV
ncbi:MAG: general secretion pathway protein GspK [Gemmatimonadaceae bacterium]|nr:general secretion pathway protein GspK [Gemmatimonadaceae bacterium]